MNNPLLNPDLEMANLFLSRIAPDHEITFQVFDETKSRFPVIPSVLHGTFEKNYRLLVKYNNTGAGIFFMVNQGDGIKKFGAKSVRTEANVIRVRALFVDLDGAPIEPLIDHSLRPHIVVRSSPDKYHAYWIVDDVPLNRFSELQSRLALQFNGDRSVKDLPRVMRIPGFYHLKNEPVITYFDQELSLSIDTPAYSLGMLEATLPQISSGAEAQTTYTDSLKSTLSSRSDLENDVVPGQRNTKAAKLAGELFAKGYPYKLVLRKLLHWNTKISEPLEVSEVEQVCKSIQKTHSRNNQIEMVGHDINHMTEKLFELDSARVDRLIRSEPKPREWLLKDVLPLGKVGLIIAPGGTSKSQFALQLGVSVASNNALANAFQIGKPGSVLMLFAEEDIDDIHRRLIAIFDNLAIKEQSEVVKSIGQNLYIKSVVGQNNLLTMRYEKGGHLEETEYVDRLINTVSDLKDLRLIVIDPASRFRGGDENSNEDATRFVECLERLCQTTKATIIVVHHANKGSFTQDEQTQTAARGASALTDGVRWQMNLRTLTEKDAANFKIAKENRREYILSEVTKNNYGPPQPPVLLHRVDRGYLEAVSAESAAKEYEKRQIKLIISAISVLKVPVSKRSFEDKYAGVKNELNIAKNQARKLIDAALEQKYLEVDSGRKLSITDRGRRLIMHIQET